MSAPGPPELPLEAAREHLARKGYLSAALPPAPVSRWRRLAYLAGFSVLLAMTLAGGAVAASGSALKSVPALAVGLLPATLGTVVAAVMVATLLARLALHLGAAPTVPADALAWAGGCCVLGTVAVAVVSAPALTPYNQLPVWLAGGALAAEAVWATRRALLRDLSLGRPCQPASRRLPWLMVGAIVVAVTAVATAIALRGGTARSEPTAAAFEQPRGRVAVVAVDGLAREDVAALAERRDEGFQRIGGWGWAPLSGTGARLPAVLWTTVACGVGPERHGVIVLDEVQLLGSRDGVPLTGILRGAVMAFWGPLGGAEVVARPALTRRVPTFWEMASRAGCPVTVGGWWGSWPVRRVLGEVVSERAWLGGGTGEDAVTPGMGALVSTVWSAEARAPEATDALAEALAQRAGDASGAHLLAVAMPALDLLRRATPASSPVALGVRAEPHLTALRRVVDRLLRGGYTVWVVAVPWGAGTPFVACSAAAGGEHPAVRATALAGTWLDELALPVPAAAAPPRRDLSGREGELTRAGYGLPPPPLAAPPAHALEVQREVLRSLGYLQ